MPQWFPLAKPVSEPSVRFMGGDNIKLTDMMTAQKLADQEPYRPGSNSGNVSRLATRPTPAAYKVDGTTYPLRSRHFAARGRGALP
jgi:hypothetical protein